MRNEKGQFVDGSQGISTRFTREKSLGNQHAKGNPPNRTSFTKEHCMEKHASWKGGLQKTRDGYYRNYAPNKRMPNGRLVWQQVNGELPKGYVVIHIDGDKYNDDISNLKAISRAELILINNRK